ncbi:MAG: hypothetical protein ACOCRO_01955 [Halanaerobiales bacterium]
MKEYYNHWFPKLIDVNGIVLFKRIYYAMPEEKISNRLRRHEETHIRQQEEIGSIKFKILYFVEYLQNLKKYRNKWRFSIRDIKGYFSNLHQIAYWNISYEIEAVENEFK